MTWLAATSFLFCTGLVAFLTWRMARAQSGGGVEGYFLAGRGLTGGFIAGSLLLTNLSTEQLVGLNGAAFTDGLSVIAWEVIAAFSLVVMALAFLPRYLRGGIATVPEYLERRFGPSTRTLTTVIFLLAYALILLPMILFTGATGLIDVIGLPELTGIEDRSTLLWICSVVLGLVGSLYAIVGGLRSVAISDTLNGVGLLIGGVMIAWFGLEELGQGDVGLAIETLRTEHPEKLNSLGAADQAVPFSTLFTGVLLINLFYWTTNQQIIQRTFAASSLAEGQRGVLIAGLFKILAPIILVLPGITAYHVFEGEGNANEAYGRLVALVLPEPLIGFFAAVVVGAILSSFNSALNAAATLFGLGVAGQHFGADEAGQVRAGKLFGIAVAVVAVLVAPWLDSQANIFDYLQTANALYFIPIFAVVIAGVTMPRAPERAATVAVAAGILAISIGYWGFDVGGPESSIHKFHFLGIVFAVLLTGLFIAHLTGPQREREPEREPPVEMTPWRFAWPAAIGLTLVVVAIYVAFADPSVL